jgi:hypothetical protein
VKHRDLLVTLQPFVRLAAKRVECGGEIDAVLRSCEPLGRRRSKSILGVGHFNPWLRKYFENSVSLRGRFDSLIGVAWRIVSEEKMLIEALETGPM